MNAAFRVEPLRPSVQMGGDESEGEDVPKATVPAQPKETTYRKFRFARIAGPLFCKDQLPKVRWYAATKAWRETKKASVPYRSVYYIQ